jgi:hypothetical protein
MNINVKKTKEMRISFLKQSLELEPLRINGNKIETVKSFKLLGVWITADLTWKLEPTRR